MPSHSIAFKTSTSHRATIAEAAAMFHRLYVDTMNYSDLTLYIVAFRNAGDLIQFKRQLRDLAVEIQEVPL